jgi:Ferredoxin thioredoxin reductase catalytic beta chain.
LKIKVSKDKAIVQQIRKALKENGGYCPCKLIKSEDTRCICKEFREQREDGLCHCGLYYKTVEEGDFD